MRWLLVLVLLAVPSVASAQTWFGTNGIALWGSNPSPTCTEGGPGCTGGECVACTASTYASAYATYAALSAVSGSAGDVAILSSSGDAYQWVEAVGGHNVQMWLPRHLATRITGWVVDGSSNPARIDVPGGDNLAGVLARGWATAHLVTGTCADGAGYITCTGSGSGDRGGLSFTYSSWPTYSLLVHEVDCVTAWGTTASDSCLAVYAARNTLASPRVTASLGGTADRVAFAFSYTTQAGLGYYTQANYEPGFVDVDLSGASATTVEEASLARQVPTVLRSEMTVGTMDKLFTWAYGTGSEMRIKRVLAFELSAP